MWIFATACREFITRLHQFWNYESMNFFHEIFLVWFIYEVEAFNWDENTQKNIYITVCFNNIVVVTDQIGVLPFCPNRTEQVNQSSVSRIETEQIRTEHVKSA